MKNILLILILFYCQDNILSAQLMKSFDNKVNLFYPQD